MFQNAVQNGRHVSRREVFGACSAVAAGAMIANDAVAATQNPAASVEDRTSSIRITSQWPTATLPDGSVRDY